MRIVECVFNNNNNTTNLFINYNHIIIQLSQSSNFPRLIWRHKIADNNCSFDQLIYYSICRKLISCLFVSCVTSVLSRSISTALFILRFFIYQKFEMSWLSLTLSFRSLVMSVASVNFLYWNLKSQILTNWLSIYSHKKTLSVNQQFLC